MEYSDFTRLVVDSIWIILHIVHLESLKDLHFEGGGGQIFKAIEINREMVP